jgi:uncharacterized repeat protein (TIGR01451 family)
LRNNTGAPQSASDFVVELSESTFIDGIIPSISVDSAGPSVCSPFTGVGIAGLRCTISSSVPLTPPGGILVGPVFRATRFASVTLPRSPQIRTFNPSGIQTSSTNYSIFLGSNSVDLAITADDARDPVNPGSFIFYDVAVSAVAGVVSGATVTLPGNVVSSSGTAWTCTSNQCVYVGTIASTNPSSPLSVSINSGAASPPTARTFSVTPAAGSADPVLANNSTQVTTTVNYTDLALSASTSAPNPITAGNNFSVNLSPSYVGDYDSCSFENSISTRLPSGISFVSAAAGVWNCSVLIPISPTAPNLRCSYTQVCRATPTSVPLPALSVVLGTSAAANGSNTLSFALSNALQGTEPDPNLVNNTASVNVVVGSLEADLSVTKALAAGGPTFSLNDPIGFNIQVRNNSTGPLSTSAAAVTVTDVLPAGLSFTGATGAGWSCSGAGTPVTVTCTANTEHPRGCKRRQFEQHRVGQYE